MTAKSAIQTVWIFDVDGVITDPSEKKITELQILEEINNKLEKGEPVILNTGRSISWLIEKVINLLNDHVTDQNVLKNFFAVGEKGGAWTEFNDSGDLIEKKDENISVPEKLKDEIRNLIKTIYSESMFYDESKLTMISTEMIDNHPIDDFHHRQKELTAELNNLLRNENLNKKFKVDPTTIATDVENKFVGKHFAIQRILSWLNSKNVKPQKYITFGDTFKSDIPMAEELHSQNLPVEFVYVGKENIDTSRFPFPVYQTKAKFGKGTAEFLKSANQKP